MSGLKRVVWTFDTSALVAAMEKAGRATHVLVRQVERNLWRSTLTPGERYIDRMCREVAGKPAAALRLFVAAGCVAPVLDGEVLS